MTTPLVRPEHGAARDGEIITSENITGLCQLILYDERHETSHVIALINNQHLRNFYLISSEREELNHLTLLFCQKTS